jgi:hypothetical protein
LFSGVATPYKQTAGNEISVQSGRYDRCLLSRSDRHKEDASYRIRNEGLERLI